MACDGDIDESELELLKGINKYNTFGFENLEKEINRLIDEMNKGGEVFIRSYLSDLMNSNIDEKDEIELVRVAVQTIKADGEEKYSEIKFFKMFRSKLNISNNDLIDALPEFENLEEDYLSQDVQSKNHLEIITEEYFGEVTFPKFNSIDHALAGEENE
jgi:uncharacterized tellurite resistance protein B-like protein